MADACAAVRGRRGWKQLRPPPTLFMHAGWTCRPCQRIHLPLPCCWQELARVQDRCAPRPPRDACTVCVLLLLHPPYPCGHLVVLCSMGSGPQPTTASLWAPLPRCHLLQVLDSCPLLLVAEDVRTELLGLFAAMVEAVRCGSRGVPLPAVGSQPPALATLCSTLQPAGCGLAAATAGRSCCGRSCCGRSCCGRGGG